MTDFVPIISEIWGMDSGDALRRSSAARNQKQNAQEPLEERGDM